MHYFLIFFSTFWFFLSFPYIFYAIYDSMRPKTNESLGKSRNVLREKAKGPEILFFWIFNALGQSVLREGIFKIIEKIFEFLERVMLRIMVNTVAFSKFYSKEKKWRMDYAEVYTFSIMQRVILKVILRVMLDTISAFIKKISKGCVMLDTVVKL